MQNEVNTGAGAVPWERAAIEKLLLANVRERRAARRWAIVRSLLWMGLIGAVAWFLLQDKLPGAAPVAEHTALVSIKGAIDDQGEGSADNVLPALRKAMEAKNSKALVLLINSPGGSPVQAGLINDEIRRLRAKHNKPVYVVVEDTCASAAYYIAAAADKIYVDKASLVGSIGVLLNGFGFVDTLNKLGVERRLMTAGANKGFLDPFSPQSEAHKQYAQTMLDQIHKQFIQVVKTGRGARLKETPEMFSGLFWTGEQAVQMGLADAFGSLDSVARDVVKADTVMDYTESTSLTDRLARRFGASVGEGAVGALRAMPVLR